MPEYLTTKELADLLRIKERKVYDLAAAGEVPCAKVTGKLLFPERDVRAWLDGARVGPAAGGAVPNVFLGSHDPLLDWALRESRCGLATYFDGSLDGLARFAAGEGVATGLHVFEPGTGEWNVPAVERDCAGMNAVLIGFATRRRGLIAHADAPLDGLAALEGRRVVRRQKESGAEPLFAYLLSEAGIDSKAFLSSEPVRSEADAALAIRKGEADAAFGLEAFATQYGLSFTPVIEERFDLLVDRCAWFEPPMQTLVAFLQSDTFRRHAGSFAGYDCGETGAVRWNA